jgi:hypothetical protein
MVTLAARGHSAATIDVGASGRFVITLPVGTYTVEACTRAVGVVSTNNSSLPACSNPVPTVVHAGVVTTVDMPSFQIR